MSSGLTPTPRRIGSCEQAAATVSSFYDFTRKRYRIVSVGRAKVTINSAVAPNTTFPKTPQQLGRGRTGEPTPCLQFSSEQQLTTFAEIFQELKEAVEMPKDKAQEKTEIWSRGSHRSGREAPSSAPAASVTVREGHAEIAVTQSTGSEQTRELQLQPLRRARPGRPRHCRSRRPARSREEAGVPTGRRRRTRSSRGGWRGCRRSSENRRRSGKVSENKVESHLSPCQSAAVSLEAPGGRERLKTRKTEVAP
ncbi:Homer protein-like protein 2 [Plecturocebus cupreus]